MNVGNGSGKLRTQSECLERHQALAFLARNGVHGFGTSSYSWCIRPFSVPSVPSYPSVNPVVDIVVFVAVAKSRLLNSGNGNANSHTKGAEALATGSPPAGE